MNSLAEVVAIKKYFTGVVSHGCGFRIKGLRTERAALSPQMDWPKGVRETERKNAMKRLKNCLLASAGLVILAATLSLTAPGRAVAQRVKDDCIRICDTASNPLHVIVQGITRVTGDVTINNQNAIATTVTGPVQVTTLRGESLSVIPRMKMDNIFQEQVSLTLGPAEDEEVRDFVVPANKFLEIKNASGTVTVKGTAQSFSSPDVKVLVLQANNSSVIFPLHTGSQDSTVENGLLVTTYQLGGNQVGIFGTPSDTVRVWLRRMFGAGNAEIKLELAITGEYHDF